MILEGYSILLETSPTAKLMKFLEENWAQETVSKQEEIEIDLSDLFPDKPPTQDDAEELDPWVDTVPF